jgi:hypothetical protein
MYPIGLLVGTEFVVMLACVPDWAGWADVAGDTVAVAGLAPFGATTGGA